MSLDFSGKTVIVTGAGGGLGRCHALEFARRGANVVVNDLGGAVDGSGGSSAAAESVVKEITEAGGSAIANGASVTDDAGVATMVKETMEAFGRIDVLVNNAGILRDKSFAKMTMEEFQLVIDVHLMGTVKTTHAIFPIMKEQNYGRIVVTSSSSGLYGNFGQTNYGAGKLGVVGFINTLKLEGQKYNIHANALAPIAATRMTSDLLAEESKQAMAPELVTPAVIFMSGEDAPNGQIICAGAGCFASSAIVETKGVYLGTTPTAEDVAKNWETIADLNTAKPYGQGGEQGMKFMGLIAEATKS